MKLFYSPGACSLAPHILIREAGLDVALDRVAFAKEGRTTTDGRDFFKVNPQGAVPALELDNGEVLTENAVLLQYLASLAPKAGLVPADGLAHWRTLETVNFIATELHKGFSPLFHNPTPEQREKVVTQLVSRFALLDGKLGDKDYLQGAFTIADIYATVTLRWAEKFGIDLSAFPKLQAYYSRLKARPAIKRAFEEEGLPTA